MIRLGFQLGRLPDELEAVLTPSGLQELAVFTKLWPWGEDAADVRSASISQTVAAFCQQAKRPKRYSIADFLPFQRHEPKRRVSKSKAIQVLHSFFGTKG